MMQNVVALCTAVALMILVVIGFAQKHHECWNGHVLKNWRAHSLHKTVERCGSVGHSI